ncbi:hypothetical protein QYE76_001957 [Lolium multiflorum]|uniref:Transposase (putative) gypsy type domain-containing protein n=1 Tax=Lolium multiflorum TaxID=4521 RepID=A0AAD8RNT6_LOLMU|nr:hypothetical protein QYE76_001957 [Lolium multiflorum]
MAAEDLEWERSKISNQDMNLLKRLGFNKEKETLRFPHEESYPKPPLGYRVSFVDHLIRGLSPPIHEFLRGLLFVYGLQLHQLTPNSILHVSIFITLCECFLGVHPNWALWKRIFCLRRNGSHGVAYNIGGVVICVRRTHQEYELENPEDDELLDALSLLEIHGTEAHNGLDEAEAGLSRLFPYFFHKKERPAIFIDLAQCFNGEEDLGLQLRQEGLKVGVEGTMALIAESQQQVDWSKVGDTGKIETKKWQSLIKAAKPNSKKILATLGYKPASAPSSSKPELIFDNYTATPGPSDVFPSSLLKKNPTSVEFVENSSINNSTEDLEELRQQLQSVKKQSLMLMEQSRKSSEREKIALQQTQAVIAEKDSAVAEAAAASSRENSMLQLLIDASLDMADARLFPLMDKFRDAPRIHGFVRAQLAAGARFAMIMVKICYPKLDVGQIVPKCLEKMSKRKRNFGKYDDIVTPVAEDMMDELLRMDAEFFVKGSYAEHSTRAVNNERLTIDNILGNP